MWRDHHHPVGPVTEDRESPPVARAGAARDVAERGAPHRPPAIGGPVEALDADERPVVLRAGPAPEADPLTDLGRPVADPAADPDPNAHADGHAEGIGPPTPRPVAGVDGRPGGERIVALGVGRVRAGVHPVALEGPAVPLEPDGLGGVVLSPV